MASAAVLLSAARQGAGAYACAVPDDWRQGRTAYGGLTAAIGHEAARSLDADLPPLRSAQIAFVGPVGDAMKADATVLRRGKSSAFVEVRVTSDGALAMLGTYLFMTERPSPVELAAPQAPVATLPEESAPAMRQPGPAYRNQLEFRHAAPAQDRGKPEFLCWVRLRERAGLDAASELLLIADSLPTAIIRLIAGPSQASSANWTLNMHGSDFAAPDGWWLVRSKAETAAGGISYQPMAVWDQTGNAVLTSSQTVSYFASAG